MPPRHSYLLLPWSLRRKLHVVAAALCDADDPFDGIGEVEALEYALDITLERLRGEERISGELEVYLNADTPLS